MSTADRDRKTQEDIRDEIVTKGTWWAASEIQKLREQVAAYRRDPGKDRTDSWRCPDCGHEWR